MGKITYHGWIYIQKNEGFNDSFDAYSMGADKHMRFGYGAKGAADAVDYFETTLGLGPVKLLPTPLGLRVYTEKEEEASSRPKTFQKKLVKIILQKLPNGIYDVDDESHPYAVRFRWKDSRFMVTILDEGRYLVEEIHHKTLSVTGKGVKYIENFLKENDELKPLKKRPIDTTEEED